MTQTDGLVEDEVRKIIASGEDVTNSWDEVQVVAEASRRAHHRAGLMTTNAPETDDMEHWQAVMAQARADNDAEASADARTAAVRDQLIP